MICDLQKIDIVEALFRGVRSNNPTVISAVESLIVAVTLAEGPVLRLDMCDLLVQYGLDDTDIRYAILVTLLGYNKHRRAALANFIDVFKSGQH